MPTLRRTPYRACPEGPRAPSTPSSSQGKQRAALQAGGFIGSIWSQSHPAEPLPREQGGIAPHRALQQGAGVTATNPPPPLLHVLAGHLPACPTPLNLSAYPLPQHGADRDAVPGVWVFAPPVSVPLRHGLGFLNEGWPGPQRSGGVRVSQCILVSAYKKRPRGGLRRRGDSSKWPPSLPHSQE